MNMFIVKMKLHNLTKSIYFIAVIEIIFSIIWFYNHPDLSQAVLYIALGCLLIIFGYIYEWMKRFQNQVKEQEKVLHSFDLWARQEFKKLNEKKEKKE